VVKGCDLLDGDLLAGRLVQRRAVWSAGDDAGDASFHIPDNTVSALSNDILDVILL
jgi:hypothetical protein